MRLQLEVAVPRETADMALAAEAGLIVCRLSEMPGQTAKGILFFIDFHAIAKISIN